jgi:hypothetical protein
MLIHEIRLDMRFDDKESHPKFRSHFPGVFALGIIHKIIALGGNPCSQKREKLRAKGFGRHYLLGIHAYMDISKTKCLPR